MKGQKRITASARSYDVHRKYLEEQLRRVCEIDLSQHGANRIGLEREAVLIHGKNCPY